MWFQSEGYIKISREEESFSNATWSPHPPYNTGENYDNKDPLLLKDNITFVRFVRTVCLLSRRLTIMNTGVHKFKLIKD